MTRRAIPKLQRKRYRREPKRCFHIFCEGKKTEPTYFSALKRECTNALIDVRAYGGIGVPDTIATEAIKHLRNLNSGHRGKKNSFEEADEVWAVFDRDQHPKFHDAILRCEGAGVMVGRSNPCFEIWLILHKEDYDKPDGRNEAQNHLMQLCPEYNKQRNKAPNCEDLVKQVQEAETRAERLLHRRQQEGDPYGPPSTTVGRLTAAIRVAALKAT